MSTALLFLYDGPPFLAYFFVPIASCTRRSVFAEHKEKAAWSARSQGSSGISWGDADAMKRDAKEQTAGLG